MGVTDRTTGDGGCGRSAQNGGVTYLTEPAPQRV
jgi:hypothetical protein